MHAQDTLIADIGATNARFAFTGDAPGSFLHREVLRCADFDSIDDAVAAYLGMKGVTQVSRLCFAVAGPVVDQTVQFTNNHWSIDMAALGQRYQSKVIRLINDFEAISYSLPLLSESQLVSIGGDWSLDRKKDFTLGVVGAGTGFGVGGLVRRAGQPCVPLVTEGGHVGFSPANDYQIDVLRCLLGRYPRVSNERLLSGSGLVNLYETVCMLQNRDPKQLTAADIGRLGEKGEDPHCEAAMSLFFEVLGQAAGDVALTQASFDGMYIAGGISQRYPGKLASSKFRLGFERKGRYSKILKATPTWLITEPNPGLIGASYYAGKYLSRSQVSSLKVI